MQLFACAQAPVITQSFSLNGHYQINYLLQEADHPKLTPFMVNEKKFYVSDNSPLPEYQSLYLLEHMRDNITAGETVLDMGTGTAIHALMSADKAKKVVATDINTKAIRDAQRNIDNQKQDSKVDLRQGDLFKVIQTHERFDTIINNFWYPHFSAPDSKWSLHERFFTQAGQHLKPGGKILYQSGWLQNASKVAQLVSRNNLIISDFKILENVPFGTPPVVYTIRPMAYMDKGESIR